MKKLLVLMLAVLIGFPVLAQARMKVKEDEVQEAQKVRQKKFLGSKEADPLKVSGNPKIIPDNNKVIIPYFRVTFATGGSYMNAVGGVTTSKTKVISSLDGVDEATMQQITDEIYADLRNQLTSAGYEVLDLSTLNDNASYQKLQETSTYPIIKKTFSQFTPQNQYFPGTIAVKAFMLAKDVDALLLKADYTVNFVIINKNQKKFNIVKDKSDVDVSQGISVIGELAVITEKGPVMFQIQQPIASKKVFGEVDNATTGMDKVGDKVMLAASWLQGSGLGNRHSTNRVDVKTTPEEYKAAAYDALSIANNTLAQYMRSKTVGDNKVEEVAEVPAPAAE